MRILYVSYETPIHPAGGIATYLEYMAAGMQAAGHEVFLFSWTDAKDYVEPLDYTPFQRDHVHIERINKHEIWRVIPVDSENLYLATWLSERIQAKIKEWQIDVVEATDWLAPCLALYQEMQASRLGRDKLLVTYNHGFMDTFFEADQVGVNQSNLVNQLCERQQCRISDLVIAPSQVSVGRLAGHGIETEVRLIREPYSFASTNDFSGVRNAIEYIGRISISKGIDKIIYLANILHPIFSLKQIRLIGRLVDTPFKKSNMVNYIKSRLHPDLRDLTTLTGFLPRKAALNILEPGGICPSLGSAETFSYACVESIDANLLPIVRHGTPMAEFFPEHLHHHILDEQMRNVSGLQRQMEGILADAGTIMRDVRDYCRETLEPQSIASQMSATYEEALGKKKGILSVPMFMPGPTARRSKGAKAAAEAAGAVATPRAMIDDITILIPAYKPNHEFKETVDSLVWQTAGIPRVLICDDGTPEADKHWFDYALSVLPHCEIIEQPNSGLLGARNTLIEHCPTELAIFLDTDDLFAPELIERLLEAWNHSPIVPDAVIPQRRNFYGSAEQVLRHYLDDFMHVLKNDYRMTCLIRRETLAEIGFDGTRRNGEGDDWGFWLEFTGRKYKALMLPHPDFWYRFREGSMSWPWSQGQHVGSQSMIKQALLEVCSRNPLYIKALTSALFTKNISH